MPPKTTSKSKTPASKSKTPETAEEMKKAKKEDYRRKMKDIMTNIAVKLPSDPNERQRVLKNLGKKIDEDPSNFESITDETFKKVATDTMDAIKMERAASTISAVKKSIKTKKLKKATPNSKPAPKKAALIINTTTQLIIDAFSGSKNNNFDPKNALRTLIDNGNAFKNNRDFKSQTTIAEAAQRVKNASVGKDEVNGGLDAEDIGLFLYGYRGGVFPFRTWYGGASGTQKEKYPSDYIMRTTLKNLIQSLSASKTTSNRAARTAARNKKKAVVDAKQKLADAEKVKADAKADAKKKAVEDAKKKAVEDAKKKAEKLKIDTCNEYLRNAKNWGNNSKFNNLDEMEKKDLLTLMYTAQQFVENQQNKCERKLEFDKKFDEIKEEIMQIEREIIEEKEKEVKELLKEMTNDLDEIKTLIDKGDNASTFKKMEAFKEKKKDNKIVLSFDTTGSLEKLMKRKKELYGILEQNIKEQKCNNKLKKEKEEVEKLERKIEKSEEKKRLEKMYKQRIAKLKKDAKECKTIENDFKTLQTRLKEKYEKRVKELEKPVDEIVKYIIKTFSGGADGDNTQNALEQLIKHGEAFGEKFENNRVINDTTKTKAAERVKNASEKKRADRDGLNKSDIGLFLYGHQGGLPFRRWYGGATGTHKKPPYEKIDDMRQKIKELIDPKEAERKKELQAEQKLKEQERKNAEQEAELEKKQKKAEREKQQKEAELKAEQERLQQEREANLQAELEEQKAEREKKAEQERLEQKQKEAEQKAKPQSEADVPFGVLEGKEALQFLKEKIDDKGLTLSTPNNEITRKDWFDQSEDEEEHYHATLYYKLMDGEVVQLVIACVEGPPDEDIIGEGNINNGTTMELIEIQNYDKNKAGSIKPFVKKVLKKDKYAEVKTVFLSPLDELLIKEVYGKRWKMKYVGKFDGDDWMKADKDKLIKTLGETKLVKDAKVVEIVEDDEEREEAVKKTDEERFLAGDMTKREVITYAKSKKIRLRKNTKKSAKNFATELRKKIAKERNTTYKKITNKDNTYALYDLHSIWDDQEELLPPPPSTLGLADRKAREFMVFE